MRTIRAVDLFCGAGGTSTGLIDACRKLGLSVELAAINHWDIAIETHSQNHPWAHHFCADADVLNPCRTAGRGPIDLLVASPECTHHSIARGGKPKNEQGRASAWSVLRWVEELQPREILIENVREFMDWSPLRRDGKSDRRYGRGVTFQAWMAGLRSLGYQVDVKLLNCADYGDPTTRVRMFVRGSRGWKQPAWPVSSHAKDGRPEAWHTAREIIDWTMHGSSIFSRKRPLSANTLKRIEAGIRKFWGRYAEPFLVVLHGGGSKDRGRSIELPLPTQTAGGNHVGLVEPFILPHRTFENMNADSIEKPLRTVTGHSAGFGLVEPFIMQASHTKANGHYVYPPDEPLRTVTSDDSFCMVEPFILPPEGVYRGNAPRQVEDPLQAVTSRGGGHLVEPFLVKYNGTGGAMPVTEPLHTVTGLDRFGLVEGQMLDIRFRMLEPRELARAHSFPDTYKFAGNRREQVKQIGNSVPKETAEALCMAALVA
jgi:DNA (cytosine-5)-methyltransferase 1